MMKALVKIIFFGGLALLIAGIIAPSFIDWNQHKSDVMARIEPYFKRKIEAAGNVSFQILPQPSISLGDVSVANSDGSFKNPIMTVKSIEARVKMGPLLQGRFEVEEFNLVEPVLNLDISAEGKSSLSDILAPGNAGPSATEVQLNEVTISHGTLRYTNRLTGAERSFNDLNLTVTAATLLGPYKVTGDMEYEGTKVTIDADTDTFNGDMSAPARLSFTPAANLPGVKMSGDLSMLSGIDFMGDAKISQGTLASLVNIPVLNGLDFMQQPVDLTGTVAFKSGQFSLNDINARFNGKEGLHGKLSVQFPQKGLPVVSIDAEASGMTVTAKPADRYPDVPVNYVGTVHFKGKNIVWDGRSYSAFESTLGYDGSVWTVKSMQASLPGNAQLQAAGTINPRTNSAAYSSFHLVTNDLPQTVQGLAPDDGNILRLLAVPGPFKKLNMTGSLDLTPAKASFYNINATLDDKYGVGGVLSIDRTAQKPNATAKLNFTNWENSTLSDVFLQQLSKANLDMELTAKNFIKSGVPIADVSFKGKTTPQGIQIDSLTANLTGHESFEMKGHVAGWAPVTGLEATYTLKARNPDGAARTMGMQLPPVAIYNSDLKGAMKGDAGRYSYTVEGSSETLSWQKLDLYRATFKAEGDDGAISISGLEGLAWDGKLLANILFTRQSQSAVWAARSKGVVKQIDFGKLQDQLGYRDFSASIGDMGFEMESPDSSMTAATGTVDLLVGKVSVPGFNVEKLAKTIQPPIALPEPDKLQKIVDNIFRANGSTVFKDVHGRFNIDKGRATIQELMLKNDIETLSLAGTTDLATSGYALSGKLKLAQPNYFPLVKISAATGSDYKIDLASIQDYIVKNLPPSQLPASKTDQSIKGILNRLDDSGKPDAGQPEPDEVDKIMDNLKQHQLVPLPEYNTPMPPASQ